jgi:hypothetical protein
MVFFVTRVNSHPVSSLVLGTGRVLQGAAIFLLLSLGVLGRSWAFLCGGWSGVVGGT